MMSDRQVTIDAIAAKALMLEPGECFAAKVETGDPERASDEIEESIERQHSHAVELLGEAVPLDEIGLRVIGRGVVVDRVGPDED